ncbi:hypothetical protein F2Q69_00005200 [Brassica cretica]|uniref:Uncharacterized protein n=1 Tax=Brassica cretica TaxID=69181 RepID=A0A8S9P992_BRACR|nr:hypothetical protein F2Q69_00005200 [Brassica cretica]
MVRGDAPVRTRRRQAQQSWTSDSVAGRGNGQARLARGSSMVAQRLDGYMGGYGGLARWCGRGVGRSV